MAQRIFDTDNEEDMALLWSILPEGIERISSTTNEYNTLWSKSGIDYANIKAGIILINWHKKTEITRPIQECTKQDAGKICAFWDDDGTITYGLLSDLIIEESEDRKYGCHYGRRWTHARRLTKEEIEELC